jgi:hypothetical protein
MRIRSTRLRTELCAALEEISTALLRASPGAHRAQPFPGGHSALALANHEIERALPGRGHAARARRHLALAIRALAKGGAHPYLYGGFAGVGWVAERIRGQGGDDPNVEIDAALLEYVSRDRPWLRTYDLVSGLVGYGVYALERIEVRSPRQILTRVIEHLAASAEAQRVGTAWRTRPEWWPPERRTDLSRGINLGVAHGVPGVIGLLGRALRAGIAPRRTATLLDGAVAWVLSQEMPKGSSSAFDYNVDAGAPPNAARSAWCYGDPGIAAVLLVAADASGETSWRRAAIRIGARAAARDPASAGVVDAGLCHGASGLAHVFHRLYAATRDERFRAAAEAWLARTLAMREPVRDVSFLTGTAGIALALASFATRESADWASWDRALLVSG